MKYLSMMSSTFRITSSHCLEKDLKKYIKAMIISFFLLASVPVLAQEYSKEYIDTFENKDITVKPFIIRESLSFDLYSDNRKNKIQWPLSTYWIWTTGAGPLSLLTAH